MLKITGFKYDKDTISDSIKSEIYIRESNEDDFIQVVPDSEDDERMIAIFYKDCSIIYITSFVGYEENSVIEDFLNLRIQKYYAD